MSDINPDAGYELAKLTKGAPLCSEKALFDIDEQGEWSYLGEPLPNKFARLFSSVLHRIDDQYFLITPVERLRVRVADAALLIVDYEHEDNAFLLDSSLGTQHSVIDVNGFDLKDDGIYLELERSLKGKLGRACYYRFINEFIISED
ncbi:DUF1285 domain-containing protein [uncultured Shewanella sp.]|uniref:DUF1285 domain-containing protein n=1 Tax=uncultured Shewanella sp. TaxID=173975 RepID=UPI00262F5BB0|nr:DUF1285 domain-containing protein [uncultured Shewanella sp.]